MTDFSPLSYDPDTLDPEAAALLPRLSDQDPVVRRIALIEIADLEDETLLPAIIDALEHDTSSEVRAEAARVLAAWERQEVVEAISGNICRCTGYEPIIAAILSVAAGGGAKRA